MLALLGERTPTLTEEWLTAVRPEAANLRVALERALLRRSVDPFVERAMSLYRFWVAVGGAVEGERWLADAAECLAHEEVPMRASAFAWRGDLLRVLGRLDEATVLAEKAQRLYEAIGDEAGRAGALETLGLVFTARGDLDEADEALAEALSWRRSHDPAVAGRLVANLAEVALARHEFERAAELAAEAMVEANRQGSVLGAGQTLLTLGIALLYAGRESEARVRLQEALGTYDRVEFPAGTAAVLEAIAAIEAGERPERAAELAATAAKLREENHVALDSFEREMHDSTLQRIEAAVGREAAWIAWNRGAAMTREQVLALARDAQPAPDTAA